MDERWISDLGTMYAMQSQHPKHRHAAIVFHDGFLIGWSNNKEGEHAEVRALVVAHLNGFKEKLILISIAIDKEGRLKLAKPCEPCEKYCRKHGVINLYYSTREQTIRRVY